MARADWSLRYVRVTHSTSYIDTGRNAAALEHTDLFSVEVGSYRWCPLWWRGHPPGSLRLVWILQLVSSTCRKKGPRVLEDLTANDCMWAAVVHCLGMCCFAFITPKRNTSKVSFISYLGPRTYQSLLKFVSDFTLGACLSCYFSPFHASSLSYSLRFDAKKDNKKHPVKCQSQWSLWMTSLLLIRQSHILIPRNCICKGFIK